MRGKSGAVLQVWLLPAELASLGTRESSKRAVCRSGEMHCGMRGWDSSIRKRQSVTSDLQAGWPRIGGRRHAHRGPPSRGRLWCRRMSGLVRGMRYAVAAGTGDSYDAHRAAWTDHYCAAGPALHLGAAKGPRAALSVGPAGARTRAGPQQNGPIKRGFKYAMGGFLISSRASPSLELRILWTQIILGLHNPGLWSPRMMSDLTFWPEEGTLSTTSE